MENRQTGRTSRAITNFLLTLSSAAIIWAGKELNTIDARLASLESAFKIRMYELSDVKKKQEDHTLSIADIVNRLSKLEFINDQKNHQK